MIIRIRESKEAGNFRTILLDRFLISSWLGTLQKQYGDRLTILAVAVESDEAEVRKVVNSLNLPIKWALGTPEFARSFGDIAAVPTLYLFDQTGSTNAIYYGAPPELHDTAETAIKTALK